MAGPAGRVDVVLVVGGRWHDFDWAREQLLSVLGRHDVARTRIFEDYDCLDALSTADVLVTYTCDVRPTADQQAALQSFVERGGRWLALHGTNAAIVPNPPGSAYKYSTPRAFGSTAELMGSQFLGHPPIGPYPVTFDEPDHPLVAGLDAFEVSDELYVSELFPPLRVIASTQFAGDCPSFEDAATVPDPHRPVLYQKQTGAGTVTFFILGHCRGRLDVQDLGIADLGRIDRAAWVVPEYREILRRCLAWAVHGDDWPTCTADDDLGWRDIGSMHGTTAGPSRSRAEETA